MYSLQLSYTSKTTNSKQCKQSFTATRSIYSSSLLESESANNLLNLAKDAVVCSQRLTGIDVAAENRAWQIIVSQII